MTKIIDRNLIQELSKLMHEAADNIAKQYGLQLEKRGGSFDSTTFNYSVKFVTGEVSDLDLSYAKMYDWPKIGTKYNDRGVEFEVTGYNTRSRKMPILSKDKAGKEYASGPEYVKLRMN